MARPATEGICRATPSVEACARWAAEVGEENNFGSLAYQLPPRQEDALDPRCIRHRAILRRHVQVDTHHGRLSMHVDIVERAVGGHAAGRQCRETPSTRCSPSRRAASAAGEAASITSFATGSVFEARRLNHQSGYSTVMPSISWMRASS